MAVARREGEGKISCCGDASLIAVVQHSAASKRAERVGFFLRGSNGFNDYEQLVGRGFGRFGEHVHDAFLTVDFEVEPCVPTVFHIEIIFHSIAYTTYHLIYLTNHNGIVCSCRRNGAVSHTAHTFQFDVIVLRRNELSTSDFHLAFAQLRESGLMQVDSTSRAGQFVRVAFLIKRMSSNGERGTFTFGIERFYHKTILAERSQHTVGATSWQSRDSCTLQDFSHMDGERFRKPFADGKG